MQHSRQSNSIQVSQGSAMSHVQPQATLQPRHGHTEHIVPKYNNSESYVNISAFDLNMAAQGLNP